MSSSTIKDMTELFGGGCSYKDNSCQVFVEFCTYSTTPPFLRKGHPMENNFPWQHRWIPLGGENLDMSFTVPNVPIKLVPAFKPAFAPAERRGNLKILPRTQNGIFHKRKDKVFRKHLFLI